MSSSEELDVSRLALHSLRFRRRVVELAAAEELTVDAGTWRDAIVFLERGEVELECATGGRRRFAAGAVLCLLPPVCLLRNRGSEPARLIAIARRAHESSNQSG